MPSTTRYHPYPRSQFNDTKRPGNNDPLALPSLSLFNKGVLPNDGDRSLNHSLQRYCIKPPHITDPTLCHEQNLATAKSSAQHRTTGSQDYVGHHGSRYPADPHIGESFPVSNIRSVIPPRIRRKSYNKPHADEHAVTGERFSIANTMLQLHASQASQAPSHLSGPTSSSSRHPHIALQSQGPNTYKNQDPSNPPTPPPEKEGPIADDGAGFTEESGDPVTSFQVASDDRRDSLLAPSSSSTPQASIVRDQTSRLASLRNERPDQTSLVPRARTLPSRRPTSAAQGTELEETAAKSAPLQSPRALSNDQRASNLPSSSAPSAPESSDRVLRRASKRKSKPDDRPEAPNSKRRKVASRRNFHAGASTSTPSLPVNETDAEEQTRTVLLGREPSPSQLPDDDHHLTSSNWSSASSEWISESGPRRATAQTQRVTPPPSSPNPVNAPKSKPAKAHKPLPLKEKPQKGEEEHTTMLNEIVKVPKYHKGEEVEVKEECYRCLRCCEFEGDLRAVQRHYYRHLNVRLFKCNHPLALKDDGDPDKSEGNPSQNQDNPSETCPWTFLERSELNDHVRGVHTKELSWCCKDKGCEAAFRTSSELSKHTKAHHPELLQPRRLDPNRKKKARKAVPKRNRR